MSMSSNNWGSKKRISQSIIALIIVVCCSFLFYIDFLNKISVVVYSPLFDHQSSLLEKSDEDICPQPVELVPRGLNVKNASFLLTEEYKNYSIGLLSGAIQIPTVSYDDLSSDPLKDDRLKVFNDFHLYLETKFPNVSKHLEYVNTYGLLYTINGADPSLKPIVLMAHQDVVPVEDSTVKDWKYPPFSGYFDGTRIWGRGTDDTKNSLIAILEATESLLNQGYKFNRTVILSFGFDEEVDGSRGAHHLANKLRDRYGHDDSIYMIIDEGSTVADVNGSIMGVVGVSEKGYTDLDITVRTPGGHSSEPPNHTAIGISSAIIAQLEKYHIANTTYELLPDDVVVSMFKCMAKYNPELDDETYKTYTDVKKLKRMLQNDVNLRPLISTTQAIDVITGGQKVNALPEQVRTTVNYRIDMHESVESVTNKAVAVIKDVLGSGRYGKMGLKLNNITIIEGSDDSYISVDNGQSIEPAPVSAYSVKTQQWNLLAGTSMHVLKKWFGLNYTATIPESMLGNTDTYQYSGLTPYVYRYTLGLPDSDNGAHTVNESLLAESHIATVVWYYELLQFM